MTKGALGMTKGAREDILANSSKTILLESASFFSTFVTVFRKVLSLTEVSVINAVGMRIPSKERRTIWQYSTDYRR